MADIVTSIFYLQNDRGLLVPKFEFNYVENNTGRDWSIHCGGTRGYFIRFGERLGTDFGEQSADSHFMANRVVTALFLSGIGLFRPKAMGRVSFEGLNYDQLDLHCHVDLWNDLTSLNIDGQLKLCLFDWLDFITKNLLFRRAAEDAYAALVNPIEASFYIYRGMEWLLRGAKVGWRELAEDIGISFGQIKEFKRRVNVDLGQRHGIESGLKLRSVPDHYGVLVADYLYGFCNMRKRVDPHYKGLSPEESARIVMKAMPLVPYP